MEPIKKIIIAGNSLSAFSVAATLAANLRHIEIYILHAVHPAIESPGESSVSNINAMLDLMGVSKRELILNTQATFKLGNHFFDWSRKASNYIHAFDSYGGRSSGNRLPQYVACLDDQYRDKIDQFSVAATAVREGRFSPELFDSINKSSTIAHGLHFNSRTFMTFLYDYTHRLGVKRIQELLRKVVLANDGSITALQTDSGHEYNADLYIDCTGNDSLLFGCAMGIGDIDWKDTLKIDSSLIAITPPHGLQHNELATKIQKTITGVMCNYACAK